MDREKVLLMNLSESLQIAIIVGLGPFIMSVSSLISSLRHTKKLNELHIQINSRMDELIKAAFLAGESQEKLSVKAKTNAN